MNTPRLVAASWRKTRGGGQLANGHDRPTAMDSRALRLAVVVDAPPGRVLISRPIRHARPAVRLMPAAAGDAHLPRPEELIGPARRRPGALEDGNTCGKV